MAAKPSIDPADLSARLLRDQLATASPDVLRDCSRRSSTC